MQYKVELSSIDKFDAWSGGAETLNVVRERGGIGELETFFGEVFNGEIPTKTDVNDWLWFDQEAIYRYLKYYDLLEE